MIKKVVTLSAFLCALFLFVPAGECSTNIPPEFNHNLKPSVQNKISSNFGIFNHMPNTKTPYLSKYTNNSYVKHNNNPFFIRNKNINKIGSQKVFYKNNMPYKIGNKRVIYGPNKRIKAIGNQPVYYNKGRIHKIGELPVIYNNTNEIIKIGNWSVSYDA